MEKYNISYYEPDYEDYIVYSINGTDITDEVDKAYKQYEEASKAVIGEGNTAINENRADYSLRSALTKAGWVPRTYAQDAIEYYEIEWEFAVGSSRISTQTGWIPIDDAQGHIPEVIVNDPLGLDSIVNNLVAEVVEADEEKLRLLTTVSKISQDVDTVTVTTSSGEYIEGDFAIVTFSSSALQTGLVEFKPALPEWKTDALATLESAVYSSIHVLFNSTFWDDTEYIIYAGGPEETIITNMNKVYPGSNILKFSLTNRNGESLERLTDDDTKADIVRRLEKIYDDVPTPIEIRLTRWSQDPLFYGAWGNRPPGFTRDGFDALQAPVGRIFFAGEYTDFSGIGYTFGAYDSGVEVANALDKCVRNSICQTYAPNCVTSQCSYKSVNDFINIAENGDRLCKLPRFTRSKTGIKCNWVLR